MSSVKETIPVATYDFAAANAEEKAVQDKILLEQNASFGKQLVAEVAKTGGVQRIIKNYKVVASCDSSEGECRGFTDRASVLAFIQETVNYDINAKANASVDKATLDAVDARLQGLEKTLLRARAYNASQIVVANGGPVVDPNPPVCMLTITIKIKVGRWTITITIEL